MAESVLQEPRIVAHVLRRRVDFVGDSGGKLTDRFEPMGLRQFGLDFFALRNIHVDAGVQPFSVFVLKRNGRDLHGPIALTVHNRFGDAHVFREHRLDKDAFRAGVIPLMEVTRSISFGKRTV